MPTSNLNIHNQRFGKLVALEPTDERRNNSVVWICQCDCGNVCFILAYALKNGHTRSCGCLGKGPRPYRKDITGLRYGSLTAIRPTGKTRGNSQSAEWECLCECGNTHLASLAVLQGSKVITCQQCYRKRLSERFTKHGMARNDLYQAEYSAWQSAIQRTTNPNHPSYQNYGGRGITVCERWAKSFQNFYDDMGPRPKKKSLGRIDNDKGYYKENCKWETMEEQSGNKRSNRLVTAFGETKMVAEWARQMSMKFATLCARLNAKISPEEALTRPVQQRPTRSTMQD